MMTESEFYETGGATLANDLIIAAHERNVSLTDAVDAVMSYMEEDNLELRRAFLTGFLRELFADRMGGAA